MGRKGFKAGAVIAPVPPAIVSVGEGERANVLTVAWTGTLATVPPRTYISVRPERHSYKLLRESGEFVINLAPSRLARTVDYVGTFTGAKVNKLEKCSLTPIASQHVGAPTVAECPIAIECRVCEVIPMGSHDVFIADVLGFTADEGIIDENGRIDFVKADLIAYMHGEYFALGEKLGKFGFAATKERSKRTQGDAATSAERPAEKAHPKAKKQSARPTESTASGRGAGGDRQTDKKKEGAEKPFYKSLPPRVLKRSAKKKRS